MAHDDRFERDGPRGGGPRWRGDAGFGGGWGNQNPRPQRLGDRDWRRPGDDPDYGAERYGAGQGEGFGESIAASSEPDSIFGAPGYDAGFGGPRFDRVDVGSTGSHGVHPVSSAYGGAHGSGPGMRSSARRYAALGRHGGDLEAGDVVVGRPVAVRLRGDDDQGAIVRRADARKDDIATRYAINIAVCRYQRPVVDHGTKQIVDAALRNGLLVYPSGVDARTQSVMVCPPLTIRDREVEMLIARFTRAIQAGNPEYLAAAENFIKAVRPDVDLNRKPHRGVVPTRCAGARIVVEQS